MHIDHLTVSFPPIQDGRHDDQGVSADEIADASFVLARGRLGCEVEFQGGREVQRDDEEGE